MIVDLANIVILKLHIRQTDTCAAPEPSNDHCILPLGLLYTPPYIGKYAIGPPSISHHDILLKTMIFFYPWSENIKEIYFFLFQCQQRIYFRFKSPDTKWPGVKWHPSLPPPPRQQFMNLEYFLEWCICRGGWGEFIISLGVQMIYFLGETPFSLKTNSLLLYTCSIL